MAGIAGFCRMDDMYGGDSPRWAAVLDDMCGALKHRGGQTKTRFLGANFGLAQTSRGKHGHEEAAAYNEQAFIVTDGTLFCADRTPTGAGEAALRLILHTGIDCITRLNGTFAGAAYAAAERRLYLFRDHLGVKPLFFTMAGGAVVFASEMKALFRYPGVEAAVGHDGLCEVLGLGPARRELSGVFKNVFSILPGHYAIFDANGFQQVKYWGFDSAPCLDDFAEAATTVAELLQEAVAAQARGRGVCTLLSGGLDSSIVTALLASGQTRPVDTFSFDFKDSDVHFKANAFQAERDRPYVEMMSRLFGTRHTFLECDSNDLADALTDAMIARDLPGMADIDSSLLVFSRRVAESHSVALTGECADELFNGYPWFHRAELVQAEGFPWSRDMHVRKAFLRDDVLDTLDIDGFAQAAFEASRNDVPVPVGEDSQHERERRISYLTIKWVMATLIDRGDRMCGAAGLDARVPFADKRLAAYLWNIPWAVKSQSGVKSLLRAAFTGLLPDELLQRRKNPYPKTYNPAYEALLAERLLAVLGDANAPIRALADPAKVRAFIETPLDYGKPWYGQLMAGPQMLAYWLQLNEWLKVYRVKVTV